MFSNLDIDPKETLKLAELESTLWAEAHVLTDQKREHQVQTNHINNFRTMVFYRWFMER